MDTRSLEISEKLKQLEKVRQPVPLGTPFDKLSSEISVTMGRATSAAVINELANALAAVNRARIAGLQGATRG